MSLWWFTAAPPSASTTPGFSIFLTPWMDHAKTVVGVAYVGTQSSSQLSGGYGESNPGAVNDSTSWDVWLDVGTYKICVVYLTNTNHGIGSFQFGGVTKGTIDLYSAALTYNVYTEITGIAVATAAINAYKILIASKNASSTNWINRSSYAILRTGA